MTGEDVRRIDPTERAHLLDASGYTPPIHRFAPSPGLASVVRRYWMPVWSLPEGAVSVQRVLQYPVCLLVVSHEYALLVGPSSGLSTTELSGSGWALGTMLQPAAGLALAGGPVDRLTDDSVPLADEELVTEIRSAVGEDPHDPQRQRAAVAVTEAWLAALLPVDEEGLLVNAIVEYVEGDTDVQRVSQVCEKFALTERTLQRLTARRIGLSPKWLVQRRRLHEAAERLREEPRPDLARVAADLGYADQAHFGRDFRAVTGLTPGEFAAESDG
ncbi:MULTISPECIES: helix-turn-helix domain-containing protein [Aeromicrobium]|uniref:helix-turn-helix domain-containing protein n=1 Tax=Aeromicrobium TaxID=2040 RepID=UPI00257B38E6|nr:MULTISPECIES: helix-turn-helix transcriptional regulator [Aeromicrobium]